MVTKPTNEMSKYLRDKKTPEAQKTSKAVTNKATSKSQNKRTIVFFDTNIRTLYKSRLPLMKAFQDKGFKVIVVAPMVQPEAEQKTLNQDITNALKTQGIQLIDCLLKKMRIGILNQNHKFHFKSNFLNILKQQNVTDIFIIHEETFFAIESIWSDLKSRLQPKTMTLLLGKTYKPFQANLTLQSASYEYSRPQRSTFAIHGFKALWMKPLQKIRDLKEQRLQKKRTEILCEMTHFVAQNKDDADYISNYLLNDQQPQKPVLISVNGAGIDLDDFAQQPLNAMTPLTFLFVGRLEAEKGFLDYCEAVQIVRQKYPGMLFKAIGSLPLQKNKTDYEAIASQAGVEYYGDVIDVKPYLHEAHVIVFPSHNEATSKALMEALAVGRPIITTNVSGCAQSVTPKENGVTVHIKDPWAISNAMRYFIDHSDQLKTMAIASRSLAESKFDGKKINAQIVGAIDKG